jgi:hypothetical protein
MQNPLLLVTLNPIRDNIIKCEWAKHVAHMGENINAYKVFVGNLRKRSLGRCRCRCENIKMAFIWLRTRTSGRLL